jgi:hypothetical protein
MANLSHPWWVSVDAEGLHSGAGIDLGELLGCFPAQAVIDAPVGGDGPQCLGRGPPVDFGQLPGRFQAQAVIDAPVAGDGQEGLGAGSRVASG